MRQLQLFTTAQLAAMRDRSASGNYSPSRDEFRRTQARRRAWGLAHRHAARLRQCRNGSPEPRAARPTGRLDASAPVVTRPRPLATTRGGANADRPERRREAPAGTHQTRPVGRAPAPTGTAGPARLREQHRPSRAANQQPAGHASSRPMRCGPTLSRTSTTPCYYPRKLRTLSSVQSFQTSRYPEIRSPLDGPVVTTTATAIPRRERGRAGGAGRSGIGRNAHAIDQRFTRGLVRRLGDCEEGEGAVAPAPAPRSTAGRRGLPADDCATITGSSRTGQTAGAERRQVATCRWRHRLAEAAPRRRPVQSWRTTPARLAQAATGRAPPDAR
jgi:hypothetical protein